MNDPSSERLVQRGRLGSLRTAARLLPLLVFSMGGIASTARAAYEPAIVPRPALVSEGSGAGMLIAGDVRVRLDAGDVQGLRTARYLETLLASTSSMRVIPVVGGRALPGEIRIHRASPATGLGPEAYHLDVTPQGVTIEAADEAGQFYGVVTLWQLLTASPGDARSILLPPLHIEDRPRFAWRGLMLDSARHMQSVAFIERYLDWMALHKFNMFHWHLTDDQGWRIPIRKYPRLTSIGGWRDAVGPDARISSTTGKAGAKRYGGFYSPAEIRQIVAYAAERHITIIPEIDMPGHTTAAIAAYPALGVRGFPVDRVSSDWGILPNLLNVDEATFAMIDNILDEVTQLFPGPYIHIGGDEAAKDEWKASPEIQGQMRALGITDEEGLERYFAARLGQYLTTKGRRLVGWDDIIGPDGASAELPADATVMSWHSGPKATGTIRSGHNIVIADAPIYYLDNQERSGPGEPPGWTELVSLEAIYRHEPMPSGLTPAESRHVIGIEGTMWTERARTEEWITRLAYPRAAALAEAAWTPLPRRDFDDFMRRMKVQRIRYTALGLRDGGVAIGSDTTGTSRPPRRASQDLDFCKPNTVGLDMEGPVAVDGQPVLFKIDNRDPCWVYRGADLTGLTGLRMMIGQSPYNFWLGSASPTVRLPTPRTRHGEMEVHLDRPDGLLMVSIPLEGLSPTRAPRSFSAPLRDLSGVHDLYFIVTGSEIDPRRPDVPPLTFLDSVDFDGPAQAHHISGSSNAGSEG